MSDRPLPAQTPPTVVLQGEERQWITAADGVVLEALVRVPPSGRRIVVLCHPHPLHLGTMDNAVILALTRALRDLPGGLTGSVRFNFRGVGASTGQYQGTEGGLLDALGILDWVSREYGNSSLSVAGYSFGSLVGLQASMQRQAVDRLVLIAPAIRHFPYPGFETGHTQRPAVAILVGDQDSFVGVSEAKALAKRLGGSVHVLEGADHFFVRRRREVADQIAPFLAPESCPTPDSMQRAR